MKKLTAILFALLLIMGQALSPAAAGPSASKHCACPGCQAACCAKSPTPVSQPAAPAPNTTQSPTHLLQAVGAQLSPSTAAAVHDFVPPSASASLRAAEVPLFRRNCSYLI